MSLQFKAFLYELKANRPKEIRRFAIDQDVSSSYDYLRRKVSSVFPNLGEDNFALQWKDAEGDFIWFNSDEELMQALGQISGDVFKLYIKENSEKSNEDSTPRCGGRNFGEGANYGPWGYQGGCPQRPPFGPFGFQFRPPFGQGHPRFSGCPFKNQEQNQQQSSETGQKQSASTSANENEQNQSQNNANDYLQSMGNVVADFLSPFGIDVDINVEHKGKKTKCEGTKNKAGNEEPSSSEDQQTSEPSAPRSPGEPDWTFVKEDDQEKGATQDETMETEDSRFDNALQQLISMGFNDNGGWLSNLVKSCNNDIPKVLDAMQPAKSGSK